jgi:ankyrin repeat protein
MLSKYKSPLERLFVLDIAKGIEGNLQSDQWSELVDLLIAQGVYVDATNLSYETPLHMACISGNKKMVLLLLSRGADVRAKSK